MSLNITETCTGFREHFVRKYHSESSTVQSYLTEGSDALVASKNDDVHFLIFTSSPKIKFTSEDSADATSNGRDLTLNDLEEPPRLSLKELEALFEMAEKLLDKGDIIQASEKFYKVTEEIIKILAREHNLETYHEACKKGRWTVSLLEDTVSTLRDRLGDIIKRAWSDAWDLHTKGFHENYLNKKNVNMYAESIRELFRLFKNNFYK